MKWAAVVDGIGERFALTLVAAVWLLTLGVVAILGERVNADSLAALRASGGKEVIGMKRSYVLALALCAGCAVGDPAGGSSLLPASDAGGGTRVPVPVVGVDSSADVVPVVSPDAGAPDAVPPADALADAGAPADAGLVCSGRSMFPPSCPQPRVGAALDCGAYKAPTIELAVRCLSYEAPEIPRYGGRICYGMPPGGVAALYVASCADCGSCGWAKVSP